MGEHDHILRETKRRWRRSLSMRLRCAKLVHHRRQTSMGIHRRVSSRHHAVDKTDRRRTSSHSGRAHVLLNRRSRRRAHYPVRVPVGLGLRNSINICFRTLARPTHLTSRRHLERHVGSRRETQSVQGGCCSAWGRHGWYRPHTWLLLRWGLLLNVLRNHTGSRGAVLTLQMSSNHAVGYTIWECDTAHPIL
jgi:hypothetical protein